MRCCYCCVVVIAAAAVVGTAFFQNADINNPTDKVKTDSQITGHTLRYGIYFIPSSLFPPDVATNEMWAQTDIQYVAAGKWEIIFISSITLPV